MNDQPFDIDIDVDDYPVFDGEPLDLDEDELLPSDESTPWTVCSACGDEFLPTIETVGRRCRDCTRRFYQ